MPVSLLALGLEIRITATEKRKQIRPGSNAINLPLPMQSGNRC